MGKQWQTLFSWAPKSLQTVAVTMKLKDTCSLKESYDKSRKHIKKQRHHIVNNVLYSQNYVFPVVMYRCECWAINKAEHQRIDDFELWYWRRLLRVPWTERKSNQSILFWFPIRNQHWLFNGRTDAESEAPIFWPHDVKSWHIGKDPRAKKYWGQEEKGTAEDEMVGWHHQFDWHELSKLWELLMDREA